MRVYHFIIVCFQNVKEKFEKLIVMLKSPLIESVKNNTVFILVASH